MENVENLSSSPKLMTASTKQQLLASKPNNQFQVGTVILYGIPIVSLVIESQERLCLAQISNTLLKEYSYNEIHNRRVALGITCVQCTPVQLEVLRRAGAMPVSSRRCGMITRREAERLCKSFLGDNSPPRLPEDFAFSVHHECAWGCRGSFLPSRYNSSRAKCIKCSVCGLFFSPNKFIFHSHRLTATDKYVQPDAANFNSWRRHMKLSGNPPDELVHAWEDVKAMFNGGTRKRLLSNSNSHSNSNSNPTSSHGMIKQSKIDLDKGQNHNHNHNHNQNQNQNRSRPIIPTPQIINYQGMPLPISRVSMDFLYTKPLSFAPFSTFPWLKRNPVVLPYENPFFPIEKGYQSAFKPVNPVTDVLLPQKTDDSDDEVDIETTDEKTDDIQKTHEEKLSKNEVGEQKSDEQISSRCAATEFTSCISGRIWNFSRYSHDNKDICTGDIQRNFLNDRGESLSKLSPSIVPSVNYTFTTCSSNSSTSVVNGDNNKLFY